jgi:prephenate dehydrogenase
MTEDGFARSTIAVVGLGLMGGSLALALKAAGAVSKIVGIDRDGPTLEAARARGAVDETSGELKAVRGASIVVLATPVRTILQQLQALGEIASDGALILDLGSTKQPVVRAMDQLPTRLNAVGGHPMCGKEASGFRVADPTLFQNKPFLLTPTARSTDEALTAAMTLARLTGAQPLVLDAARHDRIVAAVSHLPFVVAANLVRTVEEFADGDERVWQVASSGFRDTSRLAASDAEMMLDILLTNGENMADLMRRYSRYFAELADLIYDEAEDALRERLERAARRRSQWHGE